MILHRLFTTLALLLALGGGSSAQHADSPAKLQLRSHRSPRIGESGVELTGQVTSIGAVRHDDQPLVTLQTLAGHEDGDPATSEALFLQLPDGNAQTLRPGQMIRVRGRVKELRPGGQLTNLPITCLEADVPAVVLPQDRELPAPIVLGAGGRPVPDGAIDDDTDGSLERPETSGSVFDPDSDAIDFFESLEAMRVAVPGAVVVDSTNRYGEAVVLADGGARSTSFHGRWVVIDRGDFNPERIMVKGTREFPMPDVPIGARFEGPLVGVLVYDYANYKVVLTEPAPAVTLPSPPFVSEPVGPKRSGQVRIATYNVENLSAASGEAKIAELGRQIAGDLGAPDLVALQEVQDDSGPTDDGTVSALGTLALLTDAIEAAGGPSYQAFEIAPLDGREGGQPGGNIRVAFLVRSDGDLEPVVRGHGASDEGVAVEVGPDGRPRLSTSPGRLDPRPFRGSRVPLVMEFLAGEQRLFVVNCHLSSKGGDTPLFGVDQPPLLNSEQDRVPQARAVGAFVDALREVDRGALVVVLGDLNDFQFSRPLEVMAEGWRLHNLTDKLPAAERWTYIYQGNAQALDHILLSPGLYAKAASPTGIDYRVLHLNTPSSAGASDHDPAVVTFGFDGPQTMGDDLGEFEQPLEDDDG